MATLNDELVEIFNKIDSAEMGCEGFYYELESVAGCEMQYIEEDTFNKPRATKQILSKFLYNFKNIVFTKTNIDIELCDVAERLIRENIQLREESNRLKSATIQAQDDVIRLQNELLRFKDKHIEAIQSSVINGAVQPSATPDRESNSDDHEIGSHHNSLALVPITRASQKAVQHVDDDICLFHHQHVDQADDRSKDSALSGPKKEPGEGTATVKPRRTRVRFASSEPVYANVVIGPDRTPKERTISRRETIPSPKKKLIDELKKRHGMMISPD